MYYLINFSLGLMVVGAIYFAGQPDYLDQPQFEPSLFAAAQGDISTPISH